MMTTHAFLHQESRRRKGQKIRHILGTRPGSKMLEIGTGSGVIAHYFATEQGLACEVDAVDVADERVVHDGYSFVRVSGTSLPFPDDHFDAIISNQVIEHVGDDTAQLDHLREIARTLKPDGKAYLAAPNRWTIMEPHFHLPFLSWLPEALRTPYLRAAGRRGEYDCNLPTAGRLHRMMAAAGLSWEHQEREAALCMLEVSGESKSPLLKAAALLPPFVWTILRPVFPSFVCVIRKA